MYTRLCGLVVVVASLLTAVNAMADDPAVAPKPLEAPKTPAFDSPEANKALTEYRKKLADAKSAREAKLAELSKKRQEFEERYRQDLLKLLEAAKVVAAQAVNLKEANELQRVIDQVKAGPPASNVTKSEKQSGNQKAANGQGDEQPAGEDAERK